MSDMYEKLGNLLNNVLETGEIPQDDIIKDQDPVNYKDNGENSGPFSFNTSQNSSENTKKSEKIENFQKKEQKIKDFEDRFREKYTTNSEKPVGSVIKEEDTQNIKMHKYTSFMHIPCIVSKSLDTLHIVSIENLTLEDLRKKYHQILKENHPDTANKKGILSTPEELKNAFEIVKNYIFNQ